MERLIILLWFKRFDTVNKGLMRIITISIVIGTIFYLALSYGIYADSIESYKSHADFLRLNNQKVESFNYFGIFITILLSYIVLYLGFISIFRIIIWVYDGIIGKD